MMHHVEIYVSDLNASYAFWTMVLARIGYAESDSGITCLYDDKYPHANGDTDYYALFIEDPDRIKVEFVAV